MALDPPRLPDGPEPSPRTWIGSDRWLARGIGRPLHRFFHLQAGGGAVMVAAAVLALVWANSPWRDSYHALLESHTRVELGGLLVLDKPFEEWINDALMVLFFFVVGLEIKHELVVGHLRKPAAAALPAIAAVGGMAVPAALYAAFNAGGAGSSGWGIPMATDIAFAVGVVALVGRGVPSSLKVFLLTLAIVDDIGAIVIIAIFYTDELSMAWLAAAAGIVLLLVLMRLGRVWYTPVYLAVGVVFWLALFKSGVHATIAGVIMGLFAPARPLLSRTAPWEMPPERFPDAEDASRLTFEAHEKVTMTDQFGAFSERVLSVEGARRLSFEVRERVAVADRLADWLHPWTSFLIIPVFALANAGVEVSRDSLDQALSSPITIGIVVGLVVGKILGVSSFTWLAVRLGLCRLPEGATWRAVMGVGALAGIGFTVSLFITNLAFAPEHMISQATIGILAASTIAALAGAAILRGSQPAGTASSEH